MIVEEIQHHNIPNPSFLICPDSFKGSLSSQEASHCIIEGIRAVIPHAQITVIPLSDGGEGLVNAWLSAKGGNRKYRTVLSPIGKPIDAEFALINDDGSKTIVIESASACGLSLIPEQLRDPRYVSSYGLGQLVRHAIGMSPNRIIIGLGGTGTNDGGAGALQALGVSFFDSSGNELPAPITGYALSRLHSIDCSKMLQTDIKIILASDVDNPLIGPNGASYIYGPQKGATQETILELDATLSRFAQIIQRDIGVSIEHVKGAGAAGGLGAAFLAFYNATMHCGIDLLLDAVQFDTIACNIDWVITGEGSLDLQTLNGKAISGIINRCKQIRDTKSQGRPQVIAIAGRVAEMAYSPLINAGLHSIYASAPQEMPLAEAINKAAPLLRKAASVMAEEILQPVF